MIHIIPIDMNRNIVLFLLLIGSMATATAQRISLKTNALYWMAESPNLGVEFRMNRHVTLNVEGIVSRLGISDIHVKGEAFTPELRYWLSARPQAGHFIGLMGVATHYNLRHQDCRHNGDALGGGLTYGYSFVLSRHWSLEGSLGVGLLYRHEKHYEEGTDVEVPSRANCSKWAPVPLRAGVSFVYILK